MLRQLLITATALSATAAHAGPTPDDRSGWVIELGAGGMLGTDSAFTDRLDTLGFQREGSLASIAQSTVRVGHRLTPRLTLLGAARSLDERSYTLGNDAQYSFSSYGVSAELRGELPVGRWTAFYGQVGLGTAVRFDQLEQRDTDVGALVSGTAGAQLGAGAVGWFVEGGYLTTAGLANQLGDRHDVGGSQFTIGLRVTP